MSSADDTPREPATDAGTDTIATLRAALFDTLRNVRSGQLELDKARTINEIAKTLIDTGRVEIEHMHETGVARDSTFIAPADGTPPTGLIGVRRHLCR